jgi:putative transposase
MTTYRRAHIQGATYFFTVNLADRQSNLLVGHIERLRAAYVKVALAHPFKTLAVCVLPEHLHAIWQMPLEDADFSLRWRLIKTQFSRGLPKAKNRSASKIKHRESGLWQRRYWEHLIRNERDLQRHVDYVHFNPVKHGHVERVIDWPYSSFHRYVRMDQLPRDWAGGRDAGRSRFGE